MTLWSSVGEAKVSPTYFHPHWLRPALGTQGEPQVELQCQAHGVGHGHQLPDQPLPPAKSQDFSVPPPHPNITNQVYHQHLGSVGPMGGMVEGTFRNGVLEPRNISAVTLQRQEVGPDNLPAPLNLDGELGLNFTKRYEPGKPREAVCSEPSVHLCSWPSTVTQIPTITVLRSCWPCIRHSRFSHWQCGTNANLSLATYSAFEAFHDLGKVSLFY
jgi:hypothetical protein